MRLVIVGAGVAGLAAAWELRRRRPEIAITVYEKSRGLGGRVATRRREGFVFDHGAQIVKAPTPEILRLLTEELPGAGLRDVALPVWTFDRMGAIAEGDPALNADPKWIYADGLNRLGKLLAEGIDVRREKRVASLGPPAAGDRPPQQYHGGAQVVGGRWSVVDGEGQHLGDADAVLLTPPGPQSAEIVAASALDESVQQALLDELGRARYRRCVSLALAFARPIPRPFYGLVNVDRAHPIAWLALEHAKGPERCPPGHALLIAQMAHRWSLDHWNAPVEALVAPVVELLSGLLGEDLGHPLWCDRQGWRYALPDAAADFKRLNGSGVGLFFAGDFTTELGRVHLAIESGWRAAELIAEALG